MTEDGRLGRLSEMLKRRGFLSLPLKSTVSQGLVRFRPGRRANAFTHQPALVDHWLRLGNIVELSCPTVTPYAVLEASGHVGEFSDFMTQCLKCEEASRADTLLEGHHPNPDALKRDELQTLLFDQTGLPGLWRTEWSEVMAQNSCSTQPLAQDHRVDLVSCAQKRHKACSHPMGPYSAFQRPAALWRMQVGKGYRNEIVRQGMIRLREFNMAELEYFIDPEADLSDDLTPWDGHPITLIADGKEPTKMTLRKHVSRAYSTLTVAKFMGITWDFLTDVGIDPERLRFRQHEQDEMAHYAMDCWDAEIEGSYGWIECVGIAHRGCYDLRVMRKQPGEP